jgi:hypothetical protein
VSIKAMLYIILKFFIPPQKKMCICKIVFGSGLCRACTGAVTVDRNDSCKLPRQCDTGVPDNGSGLALDQYNDLYSVSVNRHTKKNDTKLLFPSFSCIKNYNLLP